MSLFTLALIGCLTIGVQMTFFWIISVKYKDASIIDRFWGLGFVVLASTYFVCQSQYFDPHFRQILVLALVCVWGLRLSYHIHTRNRDLAEDRRYVKLREKYGESFWWKSLYLVFYFQGSLMFLISAPILVVFNNPGINRGTVFDFLGIIVWGIGLYFEVVADYQLKKFKSIPTNKGKVLRSGLWGLTRHPNYFGDSMIWWGIFIIAIGVPMGTNTIFAPILMTYFLAKVTGAKLLEQDLVKKKPEYAAYIREVPIFFPRLKWKRKQTRDNTHKD